jgi:hypothetical protein
MRDNFVICRYYATCLKEINSFSNNQLF